MQSDKDLIQHRARCIAHEIRNQLSICDVYCEVIRKHLVKSSIENSSIDNALNCIQKSVKLIGNTLIDLKSMDNFAPHACAVNALIDECIRLSSVYIYEKNIEIMTDFDRDVNIYIDENKFQACLINLLKNAIEAIEKKGIIKVKTIVDSNKLRIKISNNGKAIPGTRRKEIFNDGFTTKKEGSGIGLYLCKKNLEAQKVSLKLLESTAKNTEFEIETEYLPNS